VVILVGIAALIAIGFMPLQAFGSMFGEENTTLVQLLVQMLRGNQIMSEVSKAASTAAGILDESLQAYHQVNAGINEIRNYRVDSFVNDLKVDFYNQYPGFGRLENATRNLAHWDDTRTSSPWTAYQAITAVAGDVAKPLRADIAAGHENIDHELILAGEAAGGFALANAAEKATVDLDRDIEQLGRLSRSASPGQAQQISARAMVAMAAQQSHVMRLLSRAVRLQSVDAALQYAGRIQAKNSAYEARDLSVTLTTAALKPPAMIGFGEGQ
jgi:hypothetical protein